MTGVDVCTKCVENSERQRGEKKTEMIHDGGIVNNYRASTLAYCTPLMLAPRIDDLTLLKNWSRALLISTAASDEGIKRN